MHPPETIACRIYLTSSGYQDTIAANIVTYLAWYYNMYNNLDHDEAYATDLDFSVWYNQHSAVTA